MKRLVPMFDNSGARYSIPEDRVDEFRADMGEVAEARRYRGKDGTAYTIPQEQEAAFRADMPDAVPVRSFAMADGTRRDFTMSEMSKFLRSKEYRESADYAEQRKALESQIGSPTWAAVKGALGGAAEGAYYGGKNALAKVATALPEAAASVGEAVGNAVNLGGNAKNAVGDWLRASGQQTKRWLGENIRGDQYDENGNLVMSGLTKDLGYEDALTKIGETAGDAAAMAVKFAPAIIAGPAYMETIMASDGVNAYADTFDRAKAAGYSDADANLAGAASGLINYFGAKLMMKGGAATKDIANPLLRALGGTAFTGAATAAQAVGNKGVENAIESKPITEGMLGAAGEGFVEGAQFHLINEVGTNAKASMQIRRETREMKEMRKENLLTATETPDGRAFLNTVVQNDGVDAAIRARKDGKDISRKMGAAADLPDNMSAAERNAVIDGISKAREAQAERVRTKMDDVQAQALADEVGGVLPRGNEDPMFEEVWLGVTKRVRDATELDDPQRRAELVDEAINDVVGPQKSVQESNAEIMENRRLRTPTRVGEAEIAERNANREAEKAAHDQRERDIKAAFVKNDAQKAKEERRRADDEYERQEQERIAREKAEQDAQMAEDERARAGQLIAEGAEANVPVRESSEYKAWLRKHGRTDTDKNFNRYVAERGLDASLKVERGHNGPNEETSAKRAVEAEENAMGARIEAEGEAQRKAAADKAQAEYDEKMAAYEEARAKREAEKKRYGRAKTELPEKPTPPELRVEKPKKPVITADLSDTSKNPAKVDKETPEKPEIVSTKAENRGEVDRRELRHSAHLDIYTPGDAPGGVEGARIALRVSGKTGEKQFTIELNNGESIDVGPVGSNGKFGIRKGDNIRGPFDTLGKAVQKANELYGGEKQPAKVPDGRGKMVEKKEYKVEDAQNARMELLDADSISDGKQRMAKRNEASAKLKDALHGLTTEQLYDEFGPYDGQPPTASKGWLDFFGKNGSEYASAIAKELESRGYKYNRKSGFFENKEGVSLADEIVSNRSRTKQPSQPLENAPSRAPKEKGTTSQAKGAEGKEARNGASKATQRLSITKSGKITAKFGKKLTDSDISAVESAARSLGFKAIRGEDGSVKVENSDGKWNWKLTDEDSRKLLDAVNPKTKAELKAEADAKAADEQRTAAQNDRKAFLDAHPAEAEIAKKMGFANDLQRKAVVDAMLDTPTEKDWKRSLSIQSAKAIQFLKDNGVKTEGIDSPEKLRDALRNFAGKSSTRVPDGKGRMVKKPTEPVRSAPTAQADGVTPALRERLSKTEIGRSILGNYDANAKDDPKFALEQLKRSVEANKAEIDGAKTKGKQNVVQPNLFGKSPFAPADRTSDLAIVEWAKKRGISVVNGKVSQATVERYLKDRVGKAVNATKRLFSDAKVEVKDREWSEELDGTGNVLKDNEGRVVGTFDLASKKVTLYRGADESTVYHELIGHGVEDWARRNDANLHKKLLDVAATAPKEVIDEIRKNYPGADNETVAKEIIAKIASGRAAEIIKLKDAPKRWYAKAYVAVRDALVSFMQKLGLRRIDLSRIDRMTPNEVMDHLMREIRSGKTLGKLGAEKNGEVMKSERFLNNYYDRHTSVKRMSERAWEEKHVQPGMEAGFEIELEQKESEYKDLLEKGNVANFEVGDYMKAVAAKERNANDRAEHVKQLQDGGKLKGKSEREIDLIVKKMNDGTAGITDEEADATIAHYKSHPRFKEIEKAADFLWKVQDEGMKRRVKSGLYSQEEYDAMKAAEPHHVPFRTAIDETTGEHIPWRGLRNLTGSEHAHHEGRFSRSGDPATFIFDEFTDAHIRSIENDTRRVLAEEVAKDATLGKIVTDPSIKESRVNGDGGTRNAVSYKTVENGKSLVRTILLAGERGELAASSYTNRDLAKPKWMDKEVSVLGFGMSYRKFMRGYSATATEWSGSFAVMNAVKDKVDVAKIVLVEKGVKEGSAWLKDFSKAHVDTAGEIAEFIRTGKIRKGSTLETYVNSGAMIGGLTRQGMNEITKDLSHEQIVKALKQGKSKTRAVALALPRVVKALNQYAELSTRVAAFKTELAHNGGDVRKAALWSRDITTDFNRKGNYTPVLNNIFMFSNATIGAKMRQYQALKTGFENGNYGAIVGIATASAVFATAEHIINSDDDKREAEGKAVGRDVSEYRRKTSMGLRVGSTHYGIPEHDDPISQIGYNVGLVTRAMLGDADWSTVAKELGSEAFGEVTSLLGVGSMDPSAGISSFFPSPIQPFIQDAVGKNFMGSDIRRPKFDDSLPNWANGRKSTGSQYKWVAKKLSDMTGGSDGRGGWMDVNPDTLKHYWETLGKNLGKDVAFLCETGFNIARGKVDVKANDVPAVRGIVRTYEGNDNRFYDAKRGWEKDKKELSMTKDAMTDDEAMAFAKAHPLAASASATKAITGLETKIARLRKMESGFRFVKGKAQPHEWSDDQVKEMRDERFRLQAMYIKAMREQK